MFLVVGFVAVGRQNTLADAHHAQYVFGGTLAPRTADVGVFAGIFLRNLVKHFNQNGEADGGVEVAFRDVEMEAFGNQAETDHQQKAQAQHHYGGVFIDKIG